MLTEEDKTQIRKEHRALLEKRMHETEDIVTDQEMVEHSKIIDDEVKEIQREEEDRFYADKPDYVKVKDRQGNARWMLKSEFEQKRYRKYRVRKKRTHRKSKRVLERLSVVLIILAMIIIAVVAYRIVT